MLVFPKIIFNVCNTINAVLFRVAYGYGYGLPQNPKNVTQNFYYYYSQIIKTKLEPLGFAVNCPRSPNWMTEGLTLGLAL